MKISPKWVRDFVSPAATDHEVAEALTVSGIAIEGFYGSGEDAAWEAEITTNRVDAMNHYGVAREVSAIYDVDLAHLAPKLHESGPGNFIIVVKDTEGCARYTARLVHGVRIGATPANIAHRLELIDQRSINNVADASNYVLNEIGHPTHAFDLDKLEGGKIIVRRAHEGETIVTLDGVERKLATEDLVIADAARPVAIAGVMGGEATMITESTRNVLIESAWFDPASIRRTARRLGMHTDASHRYERGADCGITSLACARVAELLVASAGGEVSEELDVHARHLEQPPIQLASSEVRRILGVEIPPAEIVRILRRLGFQIEGSGPQFTVTVPTWRLDVEREIDLIEEVARIYSYLKIPSTLPSFSGGVIEQPEARKQSALRNRLLALGYNESLSSTFIPQQEAREFANVGYPTFRAEDSAALTWERTAAQVSAANNASRDLHPSKPNTGLPGTPDLHPSKPNTGLPGTPELGHPIEPVRLANPLSEEAAYMRTSLVPGLLAQIAYNLNRGNSDVRLFEMGHVFRMEGAAVDEHRSLAFAATGAASTPNVHCKPEPLSFFHLKGDIEQLLSAFEVPGSDLSNCATAGGSPSSNGAAACAATSFEPDLEGMTFDRTVPAWLHPGQAARAQIFGPKGGGRTVAIFGQLHPEVAAARKLKQEVFVAEIFVEELYRLALREPAYTPVSRYPAVERDFSFVLPEGVEFESIRRKLASLRIAELTDIIPAETFRGGSLVPGTYSFLLRVRFQSAERTLRDDEVASWSQQIIEAVGSLGGTLRQ